MSPKAEARPAFEPLLQEMQTLVEQLESGNLDLEEALKVFERVSRLAGQCQAMLDDAELRVTRLAAETATPLADASPTDQ